MTNIPLRAYNREIEEAIEQKQIEEAIAHCQHILKTFPKHVDTYRLLGKAYLESQRFGNAADIFQRVLSSVPDDFISHVGMSIIREDEGNLDASIWHMERAFESQSYNTAIQNELRRLYGQRDGMQPPKIRMTRGALARMYAKSDLYDQAIAEIRSTLASDPQRPDLQVLLAKMYAKNTQPTQAIEVCISLLQRLPFCLDANRLLTSLLSDKQQDEITIYKQHLNALDPYEAFVSTNTPDADRVPDQAVSIMRLVWDGGPVIPETADQPEWATSIGVSLNDRNEEDLSDVMPEWLVDSEEDQQETEMGTASESIYGSTDELIPEWMKEAGWEPATGEVDESVSSLVFDETDYADLIEPGEAETADIPEWMKDMEPTSKTTQPEEIIEDSTSETISEDLPDWLNEDVDGATDTIITWLDEMQKVEDTTVGEVSPTERQQGQDEIMDEAAPEARIFQDSPDDSDSDKEVIDWTQDLVHEKSRSDGIETRPITEVPEEEVIETVPETDDILEKEAHTEASEIPDWLQNLGPEIPATKESSGVTDWLKTLEEEISEQEEELLPELETPQETANIYEQNLGGLPSEPTTEVTPDDVIEDEEIPDWLLKMKDQETASIDEVSEPMEVFQLEELPEGVQNEEDQIPEWLISLEKEAKETEADLEKPKEPSDDISFDATIQEKDIDIPEWLKSFDDGYAEPETTISSDEPFVQDEETDGSPEWLESLDTEVDATLIEAQPIIDPSASEDLESEIISEESPEWLYKLEEEIAEVEIEPEPTVIYPPYETLQEETEQEAFPEWLERMEADTEGDTKPTFVKQETETTEEVETPEPAEVPDWLQGLMDKEIETSIEEASKDIPEIILDEEPKETPEWVEEISRQEEIDEGEQTSLQEVEITSKVQPTEEIDFQDAEAAMAWLDSLVLEDNLTDDDLLSQPEEVTQDSQEGVMAEALIDTGQEDEIIIDTPEPPGFDLKPEFLDTKVGEEDINKVIETKAQKLESRLGVPDDDEMFMELRESDLKPPQPVEEDLPQEYNLANADDAIAWLESLAAKQGVSEEELLTKPEDRTETPPDWIRQEMETEIDEPSLQDEEADIEAVVTIPDWLKEAIESEDVDIGIVDDLEGESEKGQDQKGISADLPEFLRKEIEFKTEDILPTPDDEGDLIVEIEPQSPAIVAEAEIEPDLLPEEQPLEMDEIPEPEISEVFEETEPIPLVETIDTLPKKETVDVEPEGIDETIEIEKKDEDYQWVPEEVAEATSDLVVRLELNTAPLNQLERLPLIGFELAQSIITFRQENGPFESLEDLLRVPGILREMIEAIRPSVKVEPQPEPIAESIADSVEDLEVSHPSDKFHALQLEANEAFSQGKLDTAIKKFNQLIKKGKRLEEIIVDLNNILAGDIPIEIYVELLQTLGDAYMKSDQLQEALDSYTKAEELLR